MTVSVTELSDSGGLERRVARDSDMRAARRDYLLAKKASQGRGGGALCGRVDYSESYKVRSVRTGSRTLDAATSM